jgi:hypothetical protein
VAAQGEVAVGKVHRVSVLRDSLTPKTTYQAGILPGFSGFNIMTRVYVFYSKDLALNVYDKKTLSATDKKKLKNDGFKKINIEFTATDESEAIDKLLNHYKENTEALKEFSKDELLPSVIWALIYR